MICQYEIESDEILDPLFRDSPDGCLVSKPFNLDNNRINYDVGNRSLRQRCGDAVPPLPYEKASLHKKSTIPTWSDDLFGTDFSSPTSSSGSNDVLEEWDKRMLQVPKSGTTLTAESIAEHFSSTSAKIGIIKPAPSAKRPSLESKSETNEAIANPADIEGSLSWQTTSRDELYLPDHGYDKPTMAVQDVPRNKSTNTLPQPRFFPSGRSFEPVRSSAPPSGVIGDILNVLGPPLVNQSMIRVIGGRVKDAVDKLEKKDVGPSLLYPAQKLNGGKALIPSTS